MYLQSGVLHTLAAPIFGCRLKAMASWRSQQSNDLYRSLWALASDESSHDWLWVSECRCASMLLISTPFPSSHLPVQTHMCTRRGFLKAVCLHHHFLLYCLAGELSVSAFSTMLFFARFCPGFMLAGPPAPVLLWSVPKPANQNTTTSLLALSCPRAGRALACKKDDIVVRRDI